MSFYRYDTTVQQPLGPAVPGAEVAVLTQPADFSTQPGSPLATLYAASVSNSANVTAASWAAQQIVFTLDAVPADVVPDSYIAISGSDPSSFDSTVEAPYLVLLVNGLDVTVQAFTNPGTWVSGSVVATSALPNPTSTDGNGHAFFYAPAGLYSVQIYGPIEEQDYPDQGVGTVAGGTVTSVAIAGDGVIFDASVTGSPITIAGTFDLSASLLTQVANTFLAGPDGGPDAQPTFRALAADDIPPLDYVSSVALTVAVPSILTQSVTGSPITDSGTLAITLGVANQNANIVWAGPISGGAGAPAFRALVTADMPAVTVPGKTLSGSSDAVTFPSDNFVTTAGVDGMSLATPTATTDDFKRIRVFDAGGHAHTITTASNKIVPAHHVATFNGTAGSYIEFEAYQGLWYPVSSTGVNIT